ncbi:MAG: hypothetical protein UR81_C0013G0023 [Candidatus Levybacteria bacterium GW2011_GWB1_35_5]|nr:MAG: hypothetical protein UR81_C0013G0023 [Candidatus Levybacteria bacterium GW2011_GWB1_35_5]
MKITVIAHPNAKRPRIEKDLLGTIHVYVKEPPLEGKANNAIINALENHFNVKRSNIILTNGDKSKNKTFEILS